MSGGSSGGGSSAASPASAARGRRRSWRPGNASAPPAPADRSPHRARPRPGAPRPARSGRCALLLGHHHHPAPAGPVGELALQVVHQRLGAEDSSAISSRPSSQCTRCTSRSSASLMVMSRFSAASAIISETWPWQASASLAPAGPARRPAAATAPPRNAGAARRVVARRSGGRAAGATAPPLPCGTPAPPSSLTERTTSSGVGRSAA